MKVRYFVFNLLFLFLFSCQSFSKETENYFVDLKTSPVTPSLFGENVISTPLYERDIAISLQGDEIVYTLGDNKQNKRCLVIIKKQNGNWSKPEILNISGKYQDIEPFFGPNGNRLYFASNRPIFNDETRNDYNIWYSDKIEETWSEPISLDSIINSKEDEFFPSLSKKGNLFFTSVRQNGIGREDIFMSKIIDGKFLPPQPLSSQINTSNFEFNAFISPNEEYLIFSSFGRPDGFGGGDLYISKKDQNGNWEEAKNMGAVINSDKLDFCPFVDFENGNFYFTSERIILNTDKIKNINDLKQMANSINNGFGNIYKIGLKEIEMIKN